MRTQEQQREVQGRASARATHYRNPVHADYFADPFVIKAHDGRYYAYGTGGGGPLMPDGRAFPVLVSDDLARWQSLGGALVPLADPPAHTYWAPEVAHADGRYYLYYSASRVPSDEGHRLRVAVAEHPAGPFIDAGVELMPRAGFTIDGSPFYDPKEEAWHLFFATDYTSDEPHGTGLAVVRLRKDMLAVETEPVPVVRACADWQIYERDRDYKGQKWGAWHCVEGPSAVYHQGRYYCFYSGGAWHGPNYGVGFAVAEHPLGPWIDDRAVHGPTVLRGIEGRVHGPGHNSTVVGPDGTTLYMVYHAWDPGHTARRMFIDPIVWTEQGPKVDGPSTEPRPLV